LTFWPASAGSSPRHRHTFKKTWSLGSFALSIPFLSTIGFFCITASLEGFDA
jgi:hypothetical protein